MIELAERSVRHGPDAWPLVRNGEHITLDVLERGRRLATALTGVDRRAARLSGARRGYFALFQAENRPDAARLLFSGIADWQRARGMEAVFGPVAPDGSGFRIGVQASGFDLPGELLNPLSPPYCDALLTGAGLDVETEWLSFALDMAALSRRRYVEAADWAAQRSGISVRALDPLRDRAGCARLHAAMELGDRIGIDEFAGQLARLRPWLDPRLVLVAERDGAPCGMMLGLRDARTGAVRIATAHVVAAHRRSGALICLLGGTVRALRTLAPTALTASVIDSTNAASVALARGAGGVIRHTYRQYTLPL